MNTQEQSITHGNDKPRQDGKAALMELMDIEVLIRHMATEEYQAVVESDLVTPLIVQLVLQRLNKAQEILTRM